MKRTGRDSEAAGSLVATAIVASIAWACAPPPPRRDDPSADEPACTRGADEVSCACPASGDLARVAAREGPFRSLRIDDTSLLPDPSPLRRVPSLRSLSVSYATPGWLSRLGALTTLEVLALDLDAGGRAVSLGGLAPLVGLRKLAVSGLAETCDVAPLAALPHLSELYLECDGVISLAPLAAAPSLARLEVRGSYTVSDPAAARALATRVAEVRVRGVAGLEAPPSREEICALSREDCRPRRGCERRPRAR